MHGGVLFGILTKMWGIVIVTEVIETKRIEELIQEGRDMGYEFSHSTALKILEKWYKTDDSFLTEKQKIRLAIIKHKNKGAVRKMF